MRCLSSLRLVPVLAAALLAAACQPAAPGGEVAATPGAVAGDPIEVTALDVPAPVATAAATPPQAEPKAAPTAAVPEPAAEAAPPPPKSEQQLACEKRRGTWAQASSPTMRICQFRTRDANKRCTRESQCEGVCLARSGTCAPVRPLLGCNEILQDNGMRVTLCID